MNLKLNPLSILRALLWIIFFLLIANTMAIGFKLNSDNTTLIGATALFDFNQEANIPTLYSSLTLLICALLLFYIFWSNRLKGSSAQKWFGLSIVFLFLTIDEIGSIHEKIMLLLHESFEFTGIFYYAWIIPYGIALLLLCTYYLRFILRLPKHIKTLFLGSATLYVGGAVGLEILGGQQDEAYGTFNLVYAFYYTMEELLEMIGVALFVYALLLYIEEFSGYRNLRVKIESSTKKKVNQIQLFDADK